MPTSERYQRIIRIDTERVLEARGSLAEVADADVVITPSGWVVKDRDGRTGRLATAQEIAVARLVRSA